MTEIKVGDRVRIHPGNCAFRQTHSYITESGGFMMISGKHEGGEYGALGEVRHVNTEPHPHPSLERHWYTVRLDRPVQSSVAGDEQYVLMYAASELIMLSTEEEEPHV